MSQNAAGSVTITHDVGLHARPSVKLTKLAKRFAAQVRIAASEEGPWIDAKSIARVMAAKLPQDTTLHLQAEGEDAQAAVAALVALVEQDFPDEPANTEAE